MERWNAIGSDASSYDRDFGGIKVSVLSLERLRDLVGDHLNRRSRLDITFLNPDYARRAFLDAGLRDRIGRFDLVLVDGNGIRLMAPLFGFRVPIRLDTDSVAPEVFNLVNEISGRVFLFGSKPGIAGAAATRLVSAFPDVVIAGTEHGFHDVARGHPGRFDDQDSRHIVEAMNESKPDFVLVSLPTPLQQDWLAEHRSAIEASIVMTGGSYIDHMASERWPQRWYPDWVARMQLEWLYRLLKEPGRLWRRYSVEFVSYVWLALGIRLSQVKAGIATALRGR